MVAVVLSVLWVGSSSLYVISELNLDSVVKFDPDLSAICLAEVGESLVAERRGVICVDIFSTRVVSELNLDSLVVIFLMYSMIAWKKFLVLLLLSCQQWFVLAPAYLFWSSKFFFGLFYSLIYLRGFGSF